MVNITIERTIYVFFGLMGTIICLQGAVFELKEEDSAVNESEECLAQESASSVIQCSLKGMKYQDKATLLQIEHLSDSRFICSFYSGAITEGQIVKKPGTNLYSFPAKRNNREEKKGKKTGEEEIAVNSYTLTNITEDGIYNITFNRTNTKMLVKSRDGGEWIVIQKRFDSSVIFDRSWEEYKKGFGTLQGEFWIGDELIHQMTNDNPKETFIKLIIKDIDIQSFKQAFCFASINTLDA